MKKKAKTSFDDEKNELVEIVAVIKYLLIRTELSTLYIVVSRTNCLKCH